MGSSPSSARHHLVFLVRALDYCTVLLPLSAPSGGAMPHVTSLVKGLSNWVIFPSPPHP